jgi:EAL domain-containing protein (putative c-di-GMP-specific phosphodiesterase class I)
MLAEHQIPVTASVGVAMFDGLTDIELLAAADLAMYEAKESGRDRFALYRSVEGSPSRPSSRLPEAERIRQGLANNHLVLFCQPIVNLESNTISQYELFVRLRTEDGALLPPSAFLYVAERFGTILSIDSWVVQQAAALIAAEAHVGRALTLNLNISAKSIGNPQLVSVIDRSLDEWRIDPGSLVFELAESAAIGNIEHAKTFTGELRSRGCRLALDDFGTGFGSFFYLKHLPFDYFKIDGDFIRGFGANTTDQLVVEAIVGIAKGMGKKTVAEFVSDQEMMDRLRKSGVDYAQGFHVGMPLPVGEVFAHASA